MATSGSFETSSYQFNQGDRSLTFEWEIQEQNIAGNYTIINWELYGSGSYPYNPKCGGFKVIIDGSIEYEVDTNTRREVRPGDVVASGSKTIYHNADGSRNFSASAEAGIYTYARNCSGSGSWSLKAIPREITLDSAPNFDDEDNPTITYTNPAGSGMTTLQACISLDGSSADIAYRDISKTSGTYTFNLTAAERKVLRAATTGNSRTVKFIIRGTAGSTTFSDSATKTLTIVNANPTINPTITDTNSVTSSLTGNTSTLVRYFSNVQINFGAAALKEATIKSMKVTCGSKSRTSNGIMNEVESGTFNFTVTDSRGNTTTKTVTKSIVNYIRLTCNYSNVEFDTDGNISFNITGNYFDGTFGATSNVLIVQYRYAKSGASLGSWQYPSVNISNNTYSAAVSFKAADYKESYVVEIKAIDELNALEPLQRTLMCLPVFDWSGEEFAFHVPVIMDNSKQLYMKDFDGVDTMMMSLNRSNQSFFGYGSYSNAKGSSYFDGNSVYIRSNNSISNTATGTIGGNKPWTNSSDKRLKEDIAEVPQVFCDIWRELQPKMFRWNEINKGDNTLHFGLIAQDVIDVFKKYGLDYKNYGFVATIPIEGVEYFALTYEYYNILTAKVLKNTLEDIDNLKKELESIKAKLVA